MEAVSPFMVSTSPIRPCSPTRTTSAMLASWSPVATTSGPETLTIFPIGSNLLSDPSCAAVPLSPGTPGGTEGDPRDTPGPPQAPQIGSQNVHNNHAKPGCPGRSPGGDSPAPARGQGQAAPEQLRARSGEVEAGRQIMHIERFPAIAGPARVLLQHHGPPAARAPHSVHRA